jgi:integrase
MHFHDLRHTHKTWLIEDGIPEIVKPDGSAIVPRCRWHLQPRHRAMRQHVVQARQRRWAAHQAQPEHEGGSDAESAA